MVTAMVEVLDVSKPQEELGPATFDSPAHVSLPCRDLKESIASYVDVLGGELPVNRPIFVSTRIADKELPRGQSAAHGVAVDIDECATHPGNGRKSRARATSCMIRLGNYRRGKKWRHTG